MEILFGKERQPAARMREVEIGELVVVVKSLGHGASDKSSERRVTSLAAGLCAYALLLTMAIAPG